MSKVKNPGEGICYTKNGHWKPTIPGVICQHCSKVFTAHKYNAQFCSKSCAAKATAKRVERTERTCPGCGKVWSAPRSNKSRYCSRKCIYDSGDWKRPKRRKCGHCCKPFQAKWRNDRSMYQAYCSADCARKATDTTIERVCANCNAKFRVTPCRASETTCSAKCSREYYTRDRHHAWQGGKVLQGGRAFRRIDRDGYEAKYEGEHRLIAAREVGRPLARGEFVICLDGDNDNIAPENLFLCPNPKEYGLVRGGSVEWPAGSNLKQMRVGNYVRPDVIITLHEWENGTRRIHERGKPISRHPQADEIIKRRKAGASVKELAEEFSTNLSNMADILRRRL